MPSLVARALVPAPGLAIALVVAATATFLSEHYDAPVMLYALLLGMALNFVTEAPRGQAGIDLAAKGLMRLGVALLGFRIGWDQVSALGWGPVIMVVTLVATTILISTLAARAMGFNLRADMDLAVHARGLIEAAMAPALRTTAQDVEQLIMLFLPSGNATIQHCAASIGVTVRTLQRMLDADGASFSALLNRARMQLSAQYLANPRVRITDIADMLGYGSTGAFTRWYTQTFGVSPRQARARNAR